MVVCFFLGKVCLRAPGRCHAKSRHLDGHCQSEGRKNLPQSSLASRLHCSQPKMKSSLDAMACGSAVILKVFPAPCHIAPPTLKGAFVDSAVCSDPGVVIRLVCGLLLFNSASGNGTALGHGWGSHAVDCTKVLASTRNHDSLPVAIEWKHFVCFVAVKLEAVQSHAISAGCCKRNP